VEDSIWGFGPVTARAEFAGVQQDVEISHFYKFHSVDQTYEHFIFLKSPSADAYFTEREYGSILFSNDAKEVELVTIESSCGSEDSIFSIFSQSGEKLTIIRDGDSLVLDLPANYLDDYLNSITAPQITSIEDLIIVEFTVLYYGMVAFFGAVLDMFLPNSSKQSWSAIYGMTRIP